MSTTDQAGEQSVNLSYCWDSPRCPGVGREVGRPGEDSWLVLGDPVLPQLPLDGHPRGGRNGTGLAASLIPNPFSNTGISCAFER